jgi:hypothetical protein
MQKMHHTVPTEATAVNHWPGIILMQSRQDIIRFIYRSLNIAHSSHHFLLALINHIKLLACNAKPMIVIKHHQTTKIKSKRIRYQVQYASAYKSYLVGQKVKCTAETSQCLCLDEVTSSQQLKKRVLGSSCWAKYATEQKSGKWKGACTWQKCPFLSSTQT